MVFTGLLKEKKSKTKDGGGKKKNFFTPLPGSDRIGDTRGGALKRTFAIGGRVGGGTGGGGQGGYLPRATLVPLGPNNIYSHLNLLLYTPHHQKKDRVGPGTAIPGRYTDFRDRRIHVFRDDLLAFPEWGITTSNNCGRRRNLRSSF